MNIGLNATCLSQKPSGARQRFIGIYSELVKSRPDFSFTIYEANDSTVSDMFPDTTNVVFKTTPLPSGAPLKRHIKGLLYWKEILLHAKHDIFEAFNLPLVKSPTGKTILTVHDLRGTRNGTSLRRRVAYKLFLEKALKNADHIVTVSESVKKEILSLRQDAEISVIYNGINIDRCNEVPSSDLDLVSNKYSLPLEFILSVGHLEPRKNYHRLVEAVALLHAKGNPCFLVIVGNDSGSGSALKSYVRNLGIGSHVLFLSQLSDYEVRCLYKLARLFVFPSSCEGFGIPILEAMAAGTPMALSNIPVFREITQDKCEYFEYDSSDSIAACINTTLNSSEVCSRLVSYGNERVEDFHISHLCAQVEMLYDKLVRM